LPALQQVCGILVWQLQIVFVVVADVGYTPAFNWTPEHVALLVVFFLVVGQTKSTKKEKKNHLFAPRPNQTSCPECGRLSKCLPTVVAVPSRRCLIRFVLCCCAARKLRKREEREEGAGLRTWGGKRNKKQRQTTKGERDMEEKKKRKHEETVHKTTPQKESTPSKDGGEKTPQTVKKAKAESMKVASPSAVASSPPLKSSKTATIKVEVKKIDGNSTPPMIGSFFFFF
jgi:hypothetical protein